MLPLDRLTDEAREGFEQHGIKEEDLTLAITLDLDTKGSFGETWLAVDKDKLLLYCMSITSDAELLEKRKQARADQAKGKKIKEDILRIPDLFKNAEFTTYNLKEVTNAYIDNFVSSNRLLAKKGVTEENKGETIIIAYATNARKKKLFAFVDLMERITKGDDVKEDDAIFEQFNAKCPKCGTVYPDQNRRICEKCTQQGAVFKRLMHYLYAFKPQLVTVVICMLLSSAISLVNPMISRFLLDDIVADPALLFEDGIPAPLAEMVEGADAASEAEKQAVLDAGGTEEEAVAAGEAVAAALIDPAYLAEQAALPGVIFKDGIPAELAAELAVGSVDKKGIHDISLDLAVSLAEYELVGCRIVGTYHEIQWVWIAIGIMFGLAVFSILVSITQNRTNAHMSTRVTLNMKLDIFTAMQKLSLSFFNNNQTGRLITRVNYDADRIRAFFIDGVPNLIINSLNIIGLTVICLILNWKMTVIVFLPVPIIVFIFKFMLPKLWRMYSKSWRRSSALNAVLGDSLNGIRVVKAFAKEAEESNRFYTYSEKQYKANLDVNKVSLTIFPLIGLLIGISSNIIWGVGGFSIMGGTMTYGDFNMFFGYIGMIFAPLSFFTQFLDQLTDTANCAQRMFEIIDTVPEVSEAHDAVAIDRIKGDIEFKKVCFHYAANRPILKNVSFKIHSGDHIGLVGHTGSGKSTIANLINRLYDVISGSISIDGVNVRQIKSESLRKNIAIVSQEIFLFKGTIADNIRYARPDATMDEIIAAARVANAHDFILNLPDGYETVVGTGSRSLSGGEKQRISIARAVLLDPSVLILDEATAAMDTETERLIQDSLNALIQGKTTITIAHRLSTLKDCNYLFAIENGEIAEEGSHTELIAKKGLYYKLYTLQSEAMKKVIQGM